MVTGLRYRIPLSIVLLTAGACRQASRPDTGAGPDPSSTKVEQRQSALTALSRSGWVASASGSGTTTPASQAVDASTTTAWRANVAQVATTQSFQVNMGSPRTFVEVRMDTSGAPTEYPRQFQVNVSNDGTNWGSPVATGTGTGAVTTIAFASQTAQYVKVTLTSTPSPAVFWSIYDFNVYDASLSRTGWTATATSTATGTGISLGGALDGSTTTRWSSASATSHQFQVDMQAPQTFNQVTLDAGSSTSGNFIRGYTVSVSSNGTSFTQVQTGTGTSRFVVINFATQQARHIRINATNATAFTWSIEEMNVLGQPTLASTHQRSAWTATGTTAASGTTLAGAIDGSTTTRWTANTVASGTFYQVDMGTYRLFNQITVDAGTMTGNFPRNYKVEISNNASTWTQIVAPTTNSAVLLTINVQPQTARHIKISLTAANPTGSAWSIQELNVSGQALSRTGWVASGSPSSTTDVAANAIDGNATTRWDSGANEANGQTFTLDMGSAQVVNQVSLDAGTSTGNYPRGYSVNLSSDGTNWGTAVATGTGSTQLVTINFLTATARFIRITQTGTASANHWSIHEINVWRIAQPCDTVTCTALDTCHVAGVCDANTVTCSNPTGNNGATCSDGNACTTGETCTNGTCGGGTTVTCTADACHTGGACVPTTGCPIRANGTTCDDSNACTNSTTCTNGTCGGGTTVTCTADACHTGGACVPTTGCPIRANGTTCDDSNACTNSTTCANGTCGGGTTVTCTTTNPCKVAGTCVAATGCPTPTNKTNGTTCDDSNACTNSTTCTNGACGGGTTVTCNGPCHTGAACVAATGCPLKANGTTCNDGDACTNSTICTNGTCGSGTPVTCINTNPCKVQAACVPASGCPAPTNKPNGTTCDDGNVCTNNTTCTTGTCGGGTAVTCTADQCHNAGTCVPGTGCPNKSNGTACDDGNACTNNTTCTSGTCGSGTAFTCVALDTCQDPGTCNPSRPSPPPPAVDWSLVGWWKMEGDGADASGGGHPLTNEGAVAAPGRFGLGMKFDGSACMTRPVWDSNGNSLWPEARMFDGYFTLMAWVSPSDQYICPSTENTIVGNGWDYSMGTSCGLESPGGPNVMGARTADNGDFTFLSYGAAPRNEWTHVAVTYDMNNLTVYINGKVAYARPAGGEVNDTEMTFGVGCMITQLTGPEKTRGFHGTIDEVMAYERTLTAQEIWSYYTAADPCVHPTHPDGSSCTDNNYCTQTDACQAGVCVGSNPLVCPTAGTCDESVACLPSQGCTAYVKPNGVTCNDGNACTQSETCQAGTCTAPTNMPIVRNLVPDDMGPLGGNFGSTEDINATGTEVGSTTAGHAWRSNGPGFMTDMGLALGLGSPSTAQAINDAGTMVGWYTQGSATRAYRYSQFGLENFAFGDGGPGPSGGGVIRGSTALDVNNANQFVGYFTNTSTTHGYRYTDGTGLEDVGDLGLGMTMMWGISEVGRAVGVSSTLSPQGFGTTHAVLWDNSFVGLVDLNDLIDPLSGWELASATRISGDFVIGTGLRDGQWRSYRLNLQTGVVDQIDGGWFSQSINDVNVSGDVVGLGYPGGNAPQAGFVYTDQLGFKKLNDMVALDPDLTWDLRSAGAINDSGAIAGSGFNSQVSGQRAFRLQLPGAREATCKSRNICGGGDGDTVCLYSDGVVETSPGHFVAVFGFDNAASTSVHPNVNQVRYDGNLVASPLPPPPTLLPAGIHSGAYLPTFDAGHTVSWTINGETVTASAGSRHLQPVVIGVSGIGVVIDGQTIVLKADVSPYAVIPNDPTLPIPGPPLGQQFHGVLKGQLGVGPTGSATYTVPISIPPAIAGMAPNLALAYNSQGGDGIAGRGWELSGLSSIHRCAKTNTQDGTAQPVEMFPAYDAGNARDAVCLDGKRLFYRGNLHYEVEAQDFSDITSTDGSQAAPQEFTVVTKTGELRHYGHRLDSRVLAPVCQAGTSSGSTTCSPGITTWLLDKVTDVWGNYYEIHYNHDLAGNGFWDFINAGVVVTEIKYTGNIGNSVDAPTPTFASVLFDYEDRPDVRHTRYATSTLPRKKRLTKVTTMVGTTTVGAYSLTYKHDYEGSLPYGPDNDPMLPSRLASIGYSSGSDSLPSLNFDWTGGGYGWQAAPHAADVGQENSYEPPVALNATASGLPGTQFIDLDGDGRQDLVQSVGANWGTSQTPPTPTTTHAWRNNGHGWTPMDAWALPIGLVDSSHRPIGFLADMDGDGILDVISQRDAFQCSGGGGNIECGRRPYVWLNRIKTKAPNEPAWQRYTILGPDGGSDPLGSWDPFGEDALNFFSHDVVADMDGDGRADIVHLHDHIHVRLNKADGWHDAPQYTISSQASTKPGEEFHVADVNRDGFPDLLHKDEALALINLGNRLNGDGTAWYTSSVGANSNPAAKLNRLVGDIDGDGLQDVMWHYLTGAQAPFTLNFGIGYSTGLNYMGYDSTAYLGAAGNVIAFTGGFSLADLNADGLADLVVPRDFIGTQFMVNTGTTWLLTSQANQVPNSDQVPDGDFMDLDGDGVIDKVFARDNQRGAWINTFEPPIITGFPNGLAQNSQVTYTVLTTAEAQVLGGTYTDAKQRTSQTTFLSVPLRVVASIATDDGLGAGTRATTTYKYESMRGSAFGRGPQGFAKMSVTDPQRITTVTEYNQLFPYTGTVATVTRFASISTSSSDPNSQDRVLVKFVRTENSYCDTTQSIAGFLQCFSGLVPEDEHAKSRFVYPYRIKTQNWGLTDSSYDFAGTVDSITKTSEMRYDAHGNNITTTVTTESSAGDSFISKTTNTYGQPGSTEERLGKVTLAVVKNTKVYDGSEITHTTQFEYGPVGAHGGQLPFPLTLGLVRKRVEPNLYDELRTVYAYDQFGHVTTTTECASDFASCQPGATNPGDPSSPDHPPFRTTTVSYDPNTFSPPGTIPAPIVGVNYGPGRFPVRTRNTLLHGEWTVYDPLTGALLQKTDSNGVHTCYTNDALGNRRTQIERCNSGAPKLTTTNQYRVPGGLGPFPSAVVSVTVPPDGAMSVKWTDVLGRTVGTANRTLNASFSSTYTTYDGAGRMARTAKPFFGQPLYFSTSTYDDLGRVKRLDQDLPPLDGSANPTSTSMTTTYFGLTVKTDQTVAGTHQVRSETKNALGKAVAITDNNGVTIGYDYDADGNLVTAGDPTFQSPLPTIQTHYDNRGRKDFIMDPDIGTWQYAYNAYGDLIKQTDMKGNDTLLTYDALARVIRKTDVSGTAEWIYDAEAGGIGQLAAVVSAPDPRLRNPCSIPYATLTDGNRAGRSYTYTYLGELKDETECVDGENFVTSFEYDQLGRASVVRYPQVGTERLAVEYHYSALGFLYYITNQADGSLFWAAKVMNARGEITDEYTGNGVETFSNRNDVTGWLMGSSVTAHADGDTPIQVATYQYDQIGNLTYRSRADASSVVASSDTFTYDPLNRLSTSTTSIPAQSYTHFERYRYDDQGLGNLVEKGGKAYTYTGCTAGSRAAGPHAVCTVGGGSPFVYDANGNVVQGADRTIVYNGENKATHIEDTATSGTVDFVYDPDGHRIVQDAGSIGGPAGSSARTVYVGLGGTGKSLYERTTRSDSVEHTQFIYAGALHGGNAFALRVTSQSGGTQSTTTRYNHFDHLGSVTTMSDERGHVITEAWGGPNATVLSYDAWGARRSPSGQAADPSSFALQPGHREFTGHEAIPGVGLVNMNGRVYDPVLGRFLSPDPNVQFAGDLQSYNRYTYVGNNPLRYTDPTGYFWGITWENGFAVAWTMTEAIIVAAACAYTVGAGCVAAMMFFIAINSAVAYQNGASWSQVAQVAVITLITEEAAILTAGAATLPAAQMIIADASIGFGQGFLTAEVAGAGDEAAVKAGLVGAAIAAGSAALSVASSHFAEKGIHSDALEGDYNAAHMEENGYAETAAKPHAYPNHAAGEGYSVGPNEKYFDLCDEGAYGRPNKWVSDNVPFANYGGYVQDGIDFNPQTFGDWVQWTGYLFAQLTMTYGGAALATTGGISAVVQIETDQR